MLVCHCHAVTDGHIRETIEAGAADVFDIAAACGAGSGCGGCLPRIQELLAGSGPVVTLLECPLGPTMPSAPTSGPERQGMERARSSVSA